MSQIPTEHIQDSHELIGDGRVDLFSLTPAGGTGTIHFKADDDVTYRGVAYKGLPLQISGEKMSADSGLGMPKLTVGQPDIDLSLFKPMIYDGWLDGATVVRQTVLLDNLLANANIKQVRTYRIKRVEHYSRTQIIVQLATLSDSLGFMMPYRQYLPPAFPSVKI